MAGYEDKILGHADEADGIEEYDNKLPTWWLGIFYGTIIFGIAYSIHYHLIGERSQVGEYEEAVVAAAIQWPAPDADALAGNATDPKAIAAGESVYMTNCVACHLADLSGAVGPNLVDAEWIHGGSYDAISKTISEGVPAKGMLAWGPILGPEKVSQVAAYVYSKGQK